MAEAKLDKLIEAVKSLKEGNSQGKEDSNVDQSSTEAAIDSLFPSIGTSRVSACQNEGNVNRFNPKVSYGIKRRKRSASSKSPNTSSGDTLTKKKGRESNCKSLLKDLILLPSPRIENVPRGRFREYLYANGFAESAVGVSDQMTEEDIKAKVSNIFEQKLELIPEPRYHFVRAIGNKIIKVNNGPYTGKLLKHISKQGPVYIRSIVDVPGEDLEGWLGEKLEDEVSDDESLLRPAFDINDRKRAAENVTMQVPVEVSDDDVDLSENSKVLKGTMPTR